MAGLSPLTSQQWDALLATAYAAACERAGIPVATLGEGSQLGAFFYAQRAALQQQGQQLGYAVVISRLANLSGADVDAYVAAFGMTRLLASFATGQVTCTTKSPVTIQIVIPIGSTFGTQSGLIYTVIADPTNAAYSQALGGYVITPTGSSSPTTVNVTVQCTIAGTIGNAQPAQINLILAGPVVPIGIGSVSNALAFNTAIDVENDAALKARFQAKFAGGTDEGSPLSILATVLGVQPGLTASVVDLNNGGTAQDAWFTVYVNTLGATAATSAQLIQEVQLAVDVIRSAGISRQVLASTIEVVNFTGHLTLAAGADVVAVPQAAVAAVTAYINGIGLDPMGNPTIVSIAQIVRAILQSSSDILDVTLISINGALAELTVAAGVQFSAGSIVFS